MNQSKSPSAPLHSRQAGNLACNIARLKIVSNLAATKSAVGEIDDTNAAAKTAATDGLNSASDGIKTIAKSLLTGAQAPADARDQVGAGLTAAQTALDGLTRQVVILRSQKFRTLPIADSGDDPAVAEAQDKLSAAIAAGQDVVAQCK
ncbi:hypothetical protein BDZ89DRAFT_1006105 [Hymenopellis radicata]|nr:hypothetical protein BDZ89DRAFT_1006105 [Hymenopellis radicata]